MENRNRKERESFGIYIKNLRERKNYALDQICIGLCTPQQLSKVERGEKTASKLLQDALLERLGVGAEDYEHYLGYEAYDHWAMRQQILHRIVWEHIESAKKLLAGYYELHIGGSVDCNDTVYRLELQFCLSMWAQIRTLEGAAREELHGILTKAAGLTVPDLWKSSLKERALSFKELNLILEAEQYGKNGPSPKHCREIISYMEQSGADAPGMAKIYPKAIYFLCKCSSETSGEREEYLLKYCDHAIEILRNGGKLYYLWELLQMREHYLERLMNGHCSDKRKKSSGRLDRLYQENKEWKCALESLYAQCHMPKNTFSYCYLYIEKGVACINDVIRIRRSMLGMSRKELSEGICDQKTLARLESRKTNSQRAVAAALFERLGLAGALSRTELITQSPEVRRLTARLRRYNHNFEPEKAEAILSQIKVLIASDIQCNLQFLMHQEICLQGEQQEIDTETYCGKMQEALELTLPLKVFLQEGEKYLTYQEQACIQSMMQRMDMESDDFRICMKRFEEMYLPIAENELLETVNGIQEFTLRYVQRDPENRRKHDPSDQYAEILLAEELRCYRMSSIARCLYGRWRNYTYHRGQGIPPSRELNAKTELTNCILFSRLSKLTSDESFFKEMLRRKTE